jgi:Uma2 family endonuclease
MAVETGLSDVHRLSADEYHRLIESGGLDENTRIELIEGLILDMSPKSPAHENVISFLMRRLFSELDLDRYEIRAAAPLSLGDSEPEPDLIVFEHDVPRPYHPETAALVVEVAVSSQRRDLRVKPSVYARANVPVYWVVDLDGRRAIMHSNPIDGTYERVEMLGEDGELTAQHVGLVPVRVAEVLAAAG